MSGYVYAIGIEHTQYVKIGQARSPEQRLAGMQGSLPFKLELLCALKVENPTLVERTLHEMLADTRVRGEWFEMPETPLPVLFAQAVQRVTELRVEDSPQAEEKSKRETVAMTVRLSRDQWERVHQFARSEGVSLSELIRQGLSLLLEEAGLPGL